MDFNVGHVYKIKKPFTNREDDEDGKERYFLYLGQGSSFDSPIYVYVATSTTQEHPDSSNSVCFAAGTFGFTKDCKIYFNDDIITYMTKEMFESYDPYEVGVLDKNKLCSVYNAIENVKKVAKIVKKDILGEIKETNLNQWI